MVSLTSPVTSFNSRLSRSTYRPFRRRKPTNSDKPQDDPAVSMQLALNRLIKTVPDPESRRIFDTEMQSFIALFRRYLDDRINKNQTNWELVRPLPPDRVVQYEQLPSNASKESLKKLAIVKVNGGLGTSMGLTGAKGVLEVKGGMSFLDLTVRQVEHLNRRCNAEVPLVLMTSFNTFEETINIVKRYANRLPRITTFNQARFPRISSDTLLPCPKHADEDKRNWYPPGHGDFFSALVCSGMLDQLLAQGKECAFVSNIDNLGATVDEKILQHMIDTECDFIMEVTEKTKADIKGGTLVDYNGNTQLLEVAQIPGEHIDEFKSCRKFKWFNTNNLWINLKAVKRVMNNGGMELDIIVNPKIMDNGRSVIQLETAAGAAIKHFERARGIQVPRSRFLPVKNCSDLLLVKSDIYKLTEHNQLVLSDSRMFGMAPVVQLGPQFKKIEQFEKRFKSIPRIMDLDLLTVVGDVYFGRDVTLKGTVIIVASEGQRIDIPDGCVLENRLLAGNLILTEL